MKRSREDLDKHSSTTTTLPHPQRWKPTTQDVVHQHNNRVKVVQVPTLSSSASNTPKPSQVPVTQRSFLPAWIPKPQSVQGISQQSQVFPPAQSLMPHQQQQQQSTRALTNSNRTYICQIPGEYNISEDQIVEPSPSPEKKFASSMPGNHQQRQPRLQPQPTHHHITHANGYSTPVMNSGNTITIPMIRPSSGALLASAPIQSSPFLPAQDDYFPQHEGNDAWASAIEPAMSSNNHSSNVSHVLQPMQNVIQPNHFQTHSNPASVVSMPDSLPPSKPRHFNAMNPTQHSKNVLRTEVHNMPKPTITTTMAISSSSSYNNQSDTSKYLDENPFSSEVPSDLPPVSSTFGMQYHYHYHHHQQHHHQQQQRHQQQQHEISGIPPKHPTVMQSSFVSSGNQVHHQSENRQEGIARLNTHNIQNEASPSYEEPPPTGAFMDIDDALLDQYVENFELESLESKYTSKNEVTVQITTSISQSGDITRADTVVTRDKECRRMVHEENVDMCSNNPAGSGVPLPPQQPPAIEPTTVAPVVDSKDLTVAKELKAAVSKKDANAVSLGSWYFDKRAKKRKYLALTGKVYVGSEAMRRCQMDQFNEQHPAIRLRSDLKIGCEQASVEKRLLPLYQEFVNLSSSCSSSQETHLLTILSSWGLPDKLVNRYKYHKIQKLFPWQIDCLMIDQGKVLDGNQNLVYSAPTSGGKTLVAEILMLRRLAQTMFIGDPKKRITEGSSSINTTAVQRKTIFFVVPFIALAEEKVNYFQDIWSDMNVGIRAYHQDNGLDNTLGKEVEVVICTIERANILLNQLLDEHRESQLSMIVIDEVHLLSDPQRGFLLEVMLSKVKYLQEQCHMFAHHVQIIGMSATLPNIHELASWLNASLYITDYRPVNLDIYACMNRKLFRCSVKQEVKQRQQQRQQRPLGDKKEKVNKLSKQSFVSTSTTTTAMTTTTIETTESKQDGHQEIEVFPNIDDGVVCNQFDDHLQSIPSRRLHVIADQSHSHSDHSVFVKKEEMSNNTSSKIMMSESYVPTAASLPRRPSASSLVGLSHSHTHSVVTTIVNQNNSLQQHQQHQQYQNQYQQQQVSSASSMACINTTASGNYQQLEHNQQESGNNNNYYDHDDRSSITIPVPVPPSKPKSKSVDLTLTSSIMDGPSNQRPQLSNRNATTVSTTSSSSSMHSTATINPAPLPVPSTVMPNATNPMNMNQHQSHVPSMKSYCALEMFHEATEALQVPGANIYLPPSLQQHNANAVMGNVSNGGGGGGGNGGITINVFNNYYWYPSIGVNQVHDQTNHSHRHGQQYVSMDYDSSRGSVVDMAYGDISSRGASASMVSNSGCIPPSSTATGLFPMISLPQPSMQDMNNTAASTSKTAINAPPSSHANNQTPNVATTSTMSLFDQVKGGSNSVSSGVNGMISKAPLSSLFVGTVHGHGHGHSGGVIASSGNLPSLPTIHEAEELYDDENVYSHHSSSNRTKEMTATVKIKREDIADENENGIFPLEEVDDHNDDIGGEEDWEEEEVFVEAEEEVPVKRIEYEPCRDLPFESPTSVTTALHMHQQQNQQPPYIDGFKALCIETIEEGKSALIFLNSKRRCESTAKIICEVVRWYRINQQSQQSQAPPPVPPPVAGSSMSMAMRPILQTAGKSLNQERNDLFAISSIQQRRMHLIDELSQTPVGLCPILRETILVGVAYHHAGLTHDERKLIEDGFRKGILQILCTTSTLSAGVNLPANRVIIRSLQMADQFISVATFRQMCGRAGRTGFDIQGEAIIMLDNSNDKVDSRLRSYCDHLLSSELDPLRSSLHLGNGGGLEKLLLEMITCGRLVKEDEVLNFVSCTLMHIQMPSSQVFELVKNAVIFLKQSGFVQLSSQGVLLPSALGKATMLSGIAPKDAVEILPSLLQARSKLLLHHGNAGLHPIFLVTPPCTLAPRLSTAATAATNKGTGIGTVNNPSSSSSSISQYSGSTGGIEPDWDNYEKLIDFLMKDYPEINALLSLLHIEYAHLIACKFQKPSIQSDRYKLYKRLYNAILLFTLIQEWPLNKILSFTSLTSSSSSSAHRGNSAASASSSSSSSSSRGQLQQLLKDASTFCGMVIVFCKKLNWPMLVSCLEELNSRLSYGVASKDVLPLVRIGSDVMSVTRARAFVKQEIKTPYDLVSVGPEKLAHILVDSLPFHERNALEMLHGSLHNSNAANTSANNSNAVVATTSNSSTTTTSTSNRNEKIYDAYLRLAKKIIQRANEFIQDELRRKQQQFYT